MSKYPRIYLAVDNCYGYKRFTDVKEWMQRSLDTGYITFTTSPTFTISLGWRRRLLHTSEMCTRPS